MRVIVEVGVSELEDRKHRGIGDLKHDGIVLAFHRSKEVVIVKVTNGRIYKFKGAMVRALVKTDNGMRVVQTAQKLNGFAHDHELERVSKKEVNEYVQTVRDLR